MAKKKTQTAQEAAVTAEANRLQFVYLGPALNGCKARRNAVYDMADRDELQRFFWQEFDRCPRLVKLFVLTSDLPTVDQDYIARLSEKVKAEWDKGKDD